MTRRLLTAWQFPAPAAPRCDIRLRRCERSAFARVAPRGASLYAVVDRTVARLHPDVGNGPFRAVLTVRATERQKTLHDVDRLAGRLHRAGMHRRDCLVVVGGGSLVDTGGLLAHLYMRGVAWVAVPTTLIGMVDAAIGGKTGVNHRRIKNFLGAFHLPRAVVVDPRFLATLGAAELRAGLCEMLKVALIADEALYRDLTRIDPVRPPRPAVWHRLIRRAVDAKIRLLLPDLYERDLDRALNLGHAVAHALERVAGPRALSHGDAVGIGLLAAALLAARTGRARDGIAEEIFATLLRWRLRPPLRVDRPSLVAALRTIAAQRGGRLREVLPLAEGRCVVSHGLTEHQLAEGGLEAIARLGVTRAPTRGRPRRTGRASA